MFFSYGNFNHDVNEVALAISRETAVNERGDMPSTIERWTLTGMLMAATTDLLTAKILALDAAYTANGYNAGMYHDNGAATAFFLNNAASIGGVRVVSGPNYPDGGPGSYVTTIPYQITLEAEFPNLTARQLVAYNEVLSFTGTGGPKFVILTPMTGNPQKQQVKARSPYRVTQSGFAVGLYQYPQVNAPIWPGAEHEEEREITPETPEWINGYQRNFKVSWKYVFESPSQLQGNPTISSL